MPTTAHRDWTCADVARLLHETGLNRAELAVLLRVSERSVTRWLTGTPPRPVAQQALSLLATEKKLKNFPPPA